MLAGARLCAATPHPRRHGRRMPFPHAPSMLEAPPCSAAPSRRRHDSSHPRAAIITGQAVDRQAAPTTSLPRRLAATKQASPTDPIAGPTPTSTTRPVVVITDNGGAPSWRQARREPFLWNSMEGLGKAASARVLGSDQEASRLGSERRRDRAGAVRRSVQRRAAGAGTALTTARSTGRPGDGRRNRQPRLPPPAQRTARRLVGRNTPWTTHLLRALRRRNDGRAHPQRQRPPTLLDHAEHVPGHAVPRTEDAGPSALVDDSEGPAPPRGQCMFDELDLMEAVLTKAV
jgi:hypothetical protein